MNPPLNPKLLFRQTTDGEHGEQPEENNESGQSH